MKHLSKGRVALLITVVLLGGAIGVAIPVFAGSLSGTLYVNPNTTAAQWVAGNQSDYRAPVIKSNISTKAIAKWIANYDPNGVTAEVSNYVSAANAAGAIPQLVPYMIPNRDCGGPSAGGAPTWAAYQTWVTNFAAGLGNKTVIIALEPDSLALMTCLSSTEIQERYTNLQMAVQKIKAANPNAKVYLDAGHSSWNSPSETASRLKSAGISYGDGFYSNASNYRYTADEVAFGLQVVSALGDTRYHQIIDTSRNGNGPLGSEWCDPEGRLIGVSPTLNTGYSHVDGFIWIKVPGEADGCAAAAGVFVPDLAYNLAGGGSATTTQVTTTTTKVTTTTTKPVTTTTTTAPNTTTTSGAGGISCAVTRLDQWGSGYVASIKVTNTGAPITSWSVPLTFSQSTSVVNSWSVSLSGAGTSWVASNTSGNGSLGTGASTEFGFQGTASGTISVSCGGTTPTTTQVTTTTQPTTTTTRVTTTTTGPTTTTTRVTTTTTQPTTTTTSGTGGLSCTVSGNSWNTGYQLDVSIKNNGSTTVGSWTATLTFAQAPNVSGYWSAVLSSSGNTVTATPLSYNASLAPGATTTFGFQGTHNGSFTMPSCTVK